MSNLLGLGKYLCISVTTDWLCLTDVCRFDSSLCNSKFRTQFLAFFNGIVFLKIEARINLGMLLQWLLLRKISIDQIFVDNSALQTDTLKLLNVCKVHQINIGHCWKSLNEQWCSIFCHLPNIKIINLNDLKNIDANILLQTVAANCPKLTRCEFTTLGRDCNASIILLSVLCKHLQYMEFSDCHWLCDKTVIALATNCNKLHSLLINDCVNKYNREHKLVTHRAVYGIVSHAHCAQLRSLSFNGCLYVTSHSLELLLPKCPQLTSLNLGNCGEAVHPVTTLPCISTHCKQLLLLDISHCYMASGDTMQTLFGSCCRITDLNISYVNTNTSTKLSSILAPLTGLTKIEFKNVSNCKECRSIWDMFERFTVVDRERCYIEGVLFAADHTDKNCSENNNSQAQSFSSFLSSGDDIMMSNVLVRCNSLSKYVFECSHSPSVLHVVQACGGSLTHLGLTARMFTLTDAMLLSVARHCSQLKVLTMQQCKLITDSGVSAVVQNNRNLREVDVHICELLSDTAVISLATYCRKLQSLNVLDCAVTGKGVASVAANCKALTALRITQHCSITEDIIKQLKTQCRGLNELYVEHPVSKTVVEYMPF